LYFVFYAFLAVVIPFVVILTFNLATVATLIRQQFRRHAVTGRRSYVNVFTKLTLLTGVAFVLAYTPLTVGAIGWFLELPYSAYILKILKTLDIVSFSLNSVMNPIICFIVCKSVRGDIKHFIRAVPRLIRRRCTCGRSQREIPTSNMNASTRAFENIELISRHASTGTSPNIATTSV